MSNPRILHLSAIYDESTESGLAGIARAQEQLKLHAGANPRWQIKLWKAKESRDLVERLRPDLLSVYDGYGHNVQRSDMARVLALKAAGGMYMDLDYVVTATATEDADPLDQVFDAMFEAEPSASAAVNGTKNYGGVSNSVLAARVPNEPFWDLYLDEMKSHSGSMSGIGYFHVLKSTGPARMKSAAKTAGKIGLAKPAIAPYAKTNPCSICDRNSSCRTAAGVVAYHENAGSWNSNRYFWHFCQCEWPWVLGAGLGLIFIIILAVVLFRGSNCKPCRG